MSFYTEMQGTAAVLIQEFGQAMQLRRSSGGAFDPVTGAVTGGADTDIPVTGIVVAYSLEEIDGTRVQQGDLRATLTAAQEPVLTDRLVIGGKEHEIISIEAKNPAGTPLVYVLQVRAL